MPTFACRDCGQLSSSKICDNCKENRNNCGNTQCNNTVPPSGKFIFCRFCACVNKDCFNIKEPGHNICRNCLSTWVRKICYICGTLEANPPFTTCMTCNDLRKECIRCEKKQVFIQGTSNPPKFYKFCFEHKCKSQGCGEQRGNNKEICTKCALKSMKHKCTKCHQHPSLKDGTTLCYLCNRDIANITTNQQNPPLVITVRNVVQQIIPTCKQQGCTEQVQFCYKKRQYHDICPKCQCENPYCENVGRHDLSGFCGNPCIRCCANGCNRVANTNFKSEWCAKCYTRYEKNGEIRCTTCPDYTTNVIATQCDECIATKCIGSKQSEKEESKFPKREWGAEESSEEPGEEGDDEEVDS